MQYTITKPFVDLGGDCWPQAHINIYSDADAGSEDGLELEYRLEINDDFELVYTDTYLNFLLELEPDTASEVNRTVQLLRDYYQRFSMRDRARIDGMFYNPDVLDMLDHAAPIARVPSTLFPRDADRAALLVFTRHHLTIDPVEKLPLFGAWGIVPAPADGGVGKLLADPNAVKRGEWYPEDVVAGPDTPEA